MILQYRDLEINEICRELFSSFIRHQVVTNCWRKEHNQWVIKEAPFIDDWSGEDYQTLVSCLKNTLQTGGFVHAAFLDGHLKGFVSVESSLSGEASPVIDPLPENQSEVSAKEQAYLDLSSLHVSEDLRGQGIGTVLFLAAKDWAKNHGAKKLYISAHSAVESQAFYKAMGCVEAQIIHKKHVEAEPYDCQLECAL